MVSAAVKYIPQITVTTFAFSSSSSFFYGKLYARYTLKKAGHNTVSSTPTVSGGSVFMRRFKLFLRQCMFYFPYSCFRRARESVICDLCIVLLMKHLRLTHTAIINNIQFRNNFNVCYTVYCNFYSFQPECLKIYHNTMFIKGFYI